MRAFAELLVDEAVFPGEGLDVLGQFSDFLSFQLGDLRLLVHFLRQAGAFRPQSLNFLFAFE